jgi:hypothetical protein
MKLKAFEYIVHKLYEWYLETGRSPESNDLNKLKILKLLFFTSAISSNEDDEGLLSTFNNYCAMPYGHVESDIYDQMWMVDSFAISRSGLDIFEDNTPDFSDADFADVKTSIDNSLSKLKEANPNLITTSAFDLVELSHVWDSWRSMYSLAKSMGKNSIHIPNEMIQNEYKIYSLN